ncbi:MAG: segregation/condensation protein A [Patescibacteria group bacterium]
MNHEFEVKTQQYTGPLEKLLELIEAKQLNINQISLADVTADFLSYIKQLGGTTEPSVLADFLVVAAKLVLIKSKTLLPNLELTEEETADIHDLESRLKLYREFKVASEGIKRIWSQNRTSYGRPLFLNLGDQMVFYPPTKLSVSDLAASLSRLLETLKELLPETVKKIKEVIITIESKIQELLGKIQGVMEYSFQSMTKEKSKKEVVVLFLALLHLLKDRLINVEQQDHFSDIILRK